MAKIYQLNMLSELLGQGTLNRFFYLALGGLEDPAVVAYFFIDSVLPHILNVMSEDTAVKRLKIFNVLDANDAIEVNGTLPGIRTSDTTSSFNAHGFQMIPSSNLFRRGGKRFPGVPDDMYVLGVPASGALTVLENCKEALWDAWVIDDNNKLVPCLAREQSATSWLVSQLIGAAFNFGTTQVTRKSYRGGGPITNFQGFTDNVTYFAFDNTGATGSAGYDSANNVVSGDLELSDYTPPSSVINEKVAKADALNGTVNDSGTFTPA